MLSRILPLLSAVLLLGTPSLHAQDASLAGFAPSHAEAQRACEAQLADRVSSDAFRAHLKRLTRAPHPAGSPANDRVRAYIDSVMTAAGLSTALYPYDLYMPSPASAHETNVALVRPERQPLNRRENIHDADERRRRAGRLAGRPAVWRPVPVALRLPESLQRLRLLDAAGPYLIETDASDEALRQ